MFESFTSQGYLCENLAMDDVNIFTLMRKQASGVLDDLILAVGSSSRKQNETLNTVIEGFCLELDQCLIKIKSLPPSSCSVGLELRIMYNLLYATAIKTWHLQLRPISVLLSKAGSVLLSLKRVHEVLSVDKCTQEDDSYQSGKTSVEEVSSVLMPLLNSLQALDSKELGQEVGMLACMWYLLTLLERDPMPFSPCLSVLSNWTLHGDEVILKHGFLEMTPSTSKVDGSHSGSKTCRLVQNLSTLLLAVSCFHKCAWKECRELASKVNDSRWSGFSTLLRAQALMADGEFMEAVGVLHTMLDGDTDASSLVLSQINRLLASCYSAQHLPRLAVVMLRRCLQIDPGSTTALFMLSKQFESLQQGDDEIECLHALVQAAEENSTNEDRRGAVRLPLLEDLLQEVVVNPDRLSTPQALYHLAVRSEQLKKYEESSKAYEKLIHIYQKRGYNPPQPHSPVIPLPDLLTVCRQAAQVFLKIPQYPRCLQLCDRVLNSILSSSSSDFPFFQPFEDPRSTQADESFTASQGDVSIDESHPVLSQFKSERKRCWSSFSTNGFASDRNEIDWKIEENRVLLMMCKAECLIAQEDKTAAVQVLSRAFQGLMECRRMVGGQRPWEVGSESARLGCSASDCKRPRYSSCQVKDTGRETPVASGDDVQDREFHQLSSHLCLFLADGFCRCGQHQQALHSARLAAQMEPGNEDCQFFLNSTLMALGRGQEGFQSWLLLRGLPHNTGSTHLHSAVQQRKDMIRTVSAEETGKERRLGAVTERQKLQLDLSALELLVKSRTKR